MTQRIPPVIDMTADGRFRVPPPSGWRALPLSFRLMVGASVVAVLALAAVVAVFALWLLSVLIPVAIVAALLAYASLRWRLWRARRAGRVPARTVF